MKWQIRWAARLYPPAWRKRYGAEFEALLEDAGNEGGAVWDVLRGAFVMRVTTTNFTAIVAGCALAGALVGGIATLARFTGYTSTASLRARWSGGSATPARVAMQQAVQAAMSRHSLSEIIKTPALSLYPSERARLPLEEIVENMRRNIAVQFQGATPDGIVLTVSFRYPNATLAQNVNRALLDRVRTEIQSKGPVEIQEGAGVGQPTLQGKRWKLILVGGGIGLLFGIVIGAVLHLMRNRQQWSLRRIAAFAAAGAIVGLTVAMRIPDEYVSTAVLQTSRHIDPDLIRQVVLNDESLADIIRTQGLYAREAAKVPPGELARRMRQRDLKISTTRQSPNTYEVSFQDTDGIRARNVTSALVSAWMRANVDAASVNSVQLELLDPPSAPASPFFPNRGVIVLTGTCGGLLLGLAASRFARAPRPS